MRVATSALAGVLAFAGAPALAQPANLALVYLYASYGAYDAGLQAAEAGDKFTACERLTYSFAYAREARRLAEGKFVKLASDTMDVVVPTWAKHCNALGEVIE